MIFGRQICVIGGLAPVSTPVHASVEDITGLQSVKQRFTAIIGLRYKEGNITYSWVLQGTRPKIMLLFTVILSIWWEIWLQLLAMQTSIRYLKIAMYVVSSLFRDSVYTLLPIHSFKRKTKMSIVN